MKTSSTARFRRCLNAQPKDVKCTYVQPADKLHEKSEPFPWFTKELFVSVFKPAFPDPRAGDDLEMDHNELLRTRSHLSTGRIGKTVTSVKKDLLKYPAGINPKPDPKNTLAVTAMKASEVDYLDCVRTVEMFRPQPSHLEASPFICLVLLSFRSRQPFQIEYYYMVSEYWNKGSSLCRRLQLVGKYSEADTRFYGSEIADALIWLHSRGLIVRRLCFCNLLLTPVGFVKLACYSLCEQNLDSGQPSNMLKQNCGDQFYASPEVVFGVEVYPTADWWSFGVILFQMLTGEVPFTGRTLGDLGKAITEATPYFPSSPLSGEVCALLKHLLHKDPRRRLGWGQQGSLDIKNHPWFKPINWTEVRDENSETPYHPIDDDHAMFPQKEITDIAEVNTKKEILRRALEPPITGQACQRLHRK